MALAQHCPRLHNIDLFETDVSDVGALPLAEYAKIPRKIRVTTLQSMLQAWLHV